VSDIERITPGGNPTSVNVFTVQSKRVGQCSHLTPKRRLHVPNRSLLIIEGGFNIAFECVAATPMTLMFNSARSTARPNVNSRLRLKTRGSIR
jgi:hypothetical protein